MRTVHAARAAVGAAALAIAANATGAEWSLQPGIGVGITYDTNPELTTAEHDSSTGLFVNAGLGMRYATERSNIDLGAAWYYANYREEAVEDTNEPVVNLRSASRVTERQTLGLDGEYRRSTLYEQRAQASTGTGDIRDTDVGLANVQRDYWWLQPYWQVQVSELHSLDLRYRHTESNYDEILDDYKEDIATIAWSYALNPRDSLTVGIRGSRFDSPTADTRSTTSTAFLGLGRAFTATSRGDLYVGGARAKEETAGVEYEVTGYVFRVAFAQRTELSRLEVVASRDANPSGGGRLVGVDQLRIDMRGSVSPRSELWLRALIFRERVLEGEDPALDRNYGEIEPGWSWSWTPEVSLSASYRYRRQKYEVEESAASSNAVFAGIGYSWPKLAVSR